MKIISFLFLALFLFSCNQKQEAVYVEYFVNGQILLPDYVCPDTLIVVDAAGLNKAFAPVEQGLTGEDWGDDQYDSLFHTYTIIANH